VESIKSQNGGWLLRITNGEWGEGGSSRGARGSSVGGGGGGGGAGGLSFFRRKQEKKSTRGKKQSVDEKLERPEEGNRGPQLPSTLRSRSSA